ncbi:hypothetical protein [Chengkuizengella sediminis]|uniref:hypothetical protein n=1 Tax=Chengkuizengella sediminis TaxID=1885917 RepID=UPI00138A6244|nr:hypothetical protein [Chengkuizengella sediminis]NDI36278.1 hypothetical protein [Chengkuizengella sediminis]
MSEKDQQYTMEEFHKKCAVNLFNQVWDLLQKDSRNTMEDDTMIHAAHASRYHWGIIGKEENLARGEWQISRVYSVLKKSERAIYHAQRCLDICLENQIGDWDLAFAYEALARAYKVTNDIEKTNKYLKLANEAGENIQDPRDKEVLIKDLQTV